MLGVQYRYGSRLLLKRAWKSVRSISPLTGATLFIGRAALDWASGGGPTSLILRVCGKYSQGRLQTFNLIAVCVNAIPVNLSGGQHSWETARLWNFLDNRLKDGGEVVSLTRRLPFTPQQDLLVFICVRGRVNPRAIMRLDRLSQIKMQWPQRESNLRPSWL
jgi:hypothetical protein